MDVFSSLSYIIGSMSSLQLYTRWNTARLPMDMNVSKSMVSIVVWYFFGTNLSILQILWMEFVDNLDRLQTTFDSFVELLLFVE